MKRSVHTLVTIAAVGVLALAWSAVVEAKDSMELVIGSGPHAGTHKLDKGILICMQQKSSGQLSAVFKDLNATDAKQISGVGFNVFNPDDPGAKKGGIRVVFGDPYNKKKGPILEVTVPGDSKGPINMSKSGKSVTLSFDGKTRDGTKLQIKAVCDEVGSY